MISYEYDAYMAYIRHDPICSLFFAPRKASEQYIESRQQQIRAGSIQDEWSEPELLQARLKLFIAHNALAPTPR